MEKKHLEVGQDLELVEALRIRPTKKSGRASMMPDLNQVQEHWGYYLLWKSHDGVSEPIPFSLEEALSVDPERYLPDFFEFWAILQRAYRAGLKQESGHYRNRQLVSPASTAKERRVGFCVSNPKGAPGIVEKQVPDDEGDGMDMI